MTAKDGETKLALIKAARAEFIEKGFMNASLRSICKNAEVTTGALYFFFKDKDDLFDAVVGGPLRELDATVGEHLRREAEGDISDPLDETMDIEDSKRIMEILFKYKEEFILILTKAQGSRYENIKDRLIDEMQTHYRLFATILEERFGCRHVDGYMIHYLAHIQIESFLYLLTHSKSREEAMKELPEVIKNLRAGGIATFGLG
ncbi:transcriptional regulator, TetR family [Oscillospiraceae bacterium]|nr:transcriptional regulator, TetR family [Oscillospiraceae bacterium]